MFWIRIVKSEPCEYPIGNFGYSRTDKVIKIKGYGPVRHCFVAGNHLSDRFR